MGISSVGVGSGILTQDVLDQLRKADEAGKVGPLNKKITAAKEQTGALEVLDEVMKNFTDAIDELKNVTLYNDTTTTVTGSSVTATSQNGADNVSFDIEVLELAKRQIEQSGQFSSKDDVVDTAAGSFDIKVGSGTPISISYDAGATLDDIKNLINTHAGDLVDASVVQLATGDFRLFLSSVATGSETANAAGSGTDIKITSASGLDTKLTTDFDNAAVQSGSDASFTFNGSAPISRASNEISDLISGVTVSLVSKGSSTVSIEQDREELLSRVNSFVAKYNDTMTELTNLTKASEDEESRGVFSSESTIKTLKSTIQNMIFPSGGVASLSDYGFDVSREGVISVDTAKFEASLDENASNVQAFFAGGDFVSNDTPPTTTTVKGIFNDFSDTVETYTKYNATLDLFKKSLDEGISSMTERRDLAIEELDNKFDVLRKRFIAFDSQINKINSASSMFTQIANAQINAQNN